MVYLATPYTEGKLCEKYQYLHYILTYKIPFLKYSIFPN